ncbi:vitamin B12 transport periplasmic protein (putative glutathione peroxidase) [Escherichia coli]|uniref:Vitamin B12 transport periplasmic protein (Putative glutathione peroxidase) n=1 Tax=Escherichia coli TaxID=562 RepID=A0A376VGW5_ECOLX|nr:vitamin B12 transport periplasmic protein (putative glutathione peroxidase) [Escherichia coli]
MQDSILTTVVKDIDGEVTTLEKYAGNVLLIVMSLKVWLNAAI